jgi:NAD(P)-dependent dehydrogenase (short-subunit alcohol dehydrogenase family)
MSVAGSGRQSRPAIFVTGGATGIGRACAEQFSRRGWLVGLYDIDVDGAAAVAESLGDGCAVAGALDVTDPEDWRAALAQFWEHSGQRLDVLFNNAGVLTTGAFETVELASHRGMLNVNVLGMINGCHSAFDYLRCTAGSRVINMASATAIYGQPDLVTYSATKFAVRGFTEGLELEWRRHGIRVSDVWPSFVRTGMAKKFEHIASAKSLGVRLSPADVAATVWACAISNPLVPRAHWTVGLQARLLALATSISPAPLSRWVVRHLAREA